MDNLQEKINKLNDVINEHQLQIEELKSVSIGYKKLLEERTSQFQLQKEEEYKIKKKKEIKIKKKFKKNGLLVSKYAK